MLLTQRTSRKVDRDGVSATLRACKQSSVSVEGHQNTNSTPDVQRSDPERWPHCQPLSTPAITRPEKTELLASGRPSRANRTTAPERDSTGAENLSKPQTSAQRSEEVNRSCFSRQNSTASRNPYGVGLIRPSAARGAGHQGDLGCHYPARRTRVWDQTLFWDPALCKDTAADG
ncbi:hypothetical protein G5714_003889 [Onychostoma macrolepis]|uniref:Uncharacterized protein n=1 Tax=Onychostoma macrolepis TaxID=369639 RepID=A0A7J6DAX3_9TELE|nr:hypothetical protein G5714_003889 [Onychostoma macrolepis]